MKRIYLTILAAWFTMIGFAQEHKVDININKDNGGGGGFFMSPVVWVVGGAIFILLLVALLRGRSSD